MENKEEKKVNDKKSSKLGIIIIIAVLVLIVIGILVFKLVPRSYGENITNEISQELIDKSTASGNSSDTKNVIITNEGIKVNVSEKIVEEKKVGKFVIKDMSVSSQSGNSVITFSIFNNSQENITNKDFTIKFLDNKGKEIKSVTGTINNLDSGSEQIVYVNSDNDLSNSYNYSFKI